jgi:hypothetical protein
MGILSCVLDYLSLFPPHLDAFNATSKYVTALRSLLGMFIRMLQYDSGEYYFDASGLDIRDQWRPEVQGRL